MRDDIILIKPDANNLARMRWSEAQKRLSGTDWDPLALISCGGTLARCKTTGRLVEHFGDHIASINESKALAALGA